MRRKGNSFLSVSTLPPVQPFSATHHPTPCLLLSLFLTHQLGMCKQSFIALIKTSPRLVRSGVVLCLWLFRALSLRGDHIGYPVKWEENPDLPTKRKRIRRAMELNGCYCGNVLSSSMAGVVECKRTGCETQWVSRILLLIGLNLLHNYSQYHLECITDDPISKNWVCDACKASGEGRGGKRSRRQCRITIFGYVPDYVSQLVQPK